jgi:hypothetical protein
MSINYTATSLLLVPFGVAWYLDLLSGRVAAVLALVVGLCLPIALYRWSRTIWLAIYFASLPHELPVNRTERIPVDDDSEAGPAEGPPSR